ncbi:diaminopimelate decarboxylase [Pseudoduganella flava]|uniref:Diaminopimelate decarboxylase n=1 Tax=Pseudoduganella flava TaxID=871742 RepID=A0A562Q1L4_9BURK|nr:type III PLP-dependent enzyme [Pseudoduganella flava]QGZ38142.1 type III PLP-dependent enzyme [Pseudoduganella flava]TWI50340.1 diaminopimelate decarboxylase [Pseudoduganella flava]
MTVPHTVPDHVVRRALELADGADDPISAFIYDLDALRERAAWLKLHLPPGVQLYYAIKANSEAPVLDALAPFVDGFEISSGGEIGRVLECGTRRGFIFSGPGKLDSELTRAMTHGVEMVHVEGLAEIGRLEALAARLGRRQDVLVRINPTLPPQLATKLSMAGAPTPFGVDEAELAEAVALVDASPHLTLRGFHVHAMSHQLDVARHMQLLDWYLGRWPAWRALAAKPDDVTCLNAGGGMGVDYLAGRQFDWPGLCRYLGERLAAMPDAPAIRFEPGRFVTAYCGYYVMQVLDLKHSHGRGFAVCRGGTHQFRLPVAQAHDHPVVHVPRGAGPRREAGRWTVVGQLCTPKDVLARDVDLPGLAVGDLLVLPLAGAYGYNISHADFLCHPRPLQVFLGARSHHTQVMEST